MRTFLPQFGFPLFLPGDKSLKILILILKSIVDQCNLLRKEVEKNKKDKFAQLTNCHDKIFCFADILSFVEKGEEETAFH